MNYVIIFILILLILYIIDFKFIKNNVNKLFNIENNKLCNNGDNKSFNNGDNELFNITEYNKNYQIMIDKHNKLSSDIQLPKTNNIMYDLNTQSINMIKNDIEKFFTKHNYYIEFIKNTDINDFGKYTVVNNTIKDILYIPSFVISIIVYYMNGNDKIKLNSKNLSLSILIDPDNNDFNIIHIKNIEIEKFINKNILYNNTIIANKVIDNTAPDTTRTNIPVIDNDIINSIIDEDIQSISNDDIEHKPTNSIFIKPANETKTNTKFHENNNTDDSLIPDIINISESENINIL